MGSVLIVLCACLATVTPAYAQPGDYLPADLRARVEQLKADMLSIPTNRANLRTRAELTWQWLNAYALNGGYVPVNATQSLAWALGRRAAAPALIEALNATIHELAFVDSNPNAIGTLTADTGPFTAGQPATVTQTYTLGDRPIQTGGAILVARHFMANFGPWQASDAAAPGYISIESSNPKVSFVASTTPVRGMHGGFRGSRPTLVFKVASHIFLRPHSIATVRGISRRRPLLQSADSAHPRHRHTIGRRSGLRTVRRQTR